MFDVITIGAATRDAFLISRAFQILSSSKFPGGKAECVALGAKVELDDMVLTTGGGATNAAATFSSLGFITAVKARIANDEPGRDILAELHKRGIDTSLMTVVKKGQTAFGTQLMTSSGERTVLIYRGVSHEFTDTDVAVSKLKTKWIYLTSLAGNTALALKIAKHARSKGIGLAWNPGSLEMKAGSLSPILKLCSIVLVNLEEAQSLAQLNTTDPKTLCKAIASPGMIVVLTDGPRGAYAFQDGKCWHARTSGAHSVSRTGAGDAFGSGFTASIMKGLSVEDALRIGTLNAESVIQKYGAKTGILSAWPKSAALEKIRVRTQ